MNKAIQIKCQGASYLQLDEIMDFQGELKKITPKNLEKLKNNILKNGFISPIFIWDNHGEYKTLDGHQRCIALKSLKAEGWEIPPLPVDFIEAENEQQARQMLLSISSQFGEFDNTELLDWIGQIDDDLRESLRLVDQEIQLIDESIQEKETEGDDDLTEDVDTITKEGDLWELGDHRLLCGDSLKPQDIDILMNGEKAVLGVNDPPYGMKKEKDGILNDNLNYLDLLEFNKKWIKLQVEKLEDNGSFYCFGTDEPLMDIYSEIIKPLIKTQKATFRNLITWDKGSGQGQMAEEFRMYPIADEKILFIMLGVQGFNNNSDNYFEGWEQIRVYLEEQRNIMKWNLQYTKEIAGHSLKSGCHWFDKSQWSMPTEKTYNSWKNKANGKAFKKEYEEIKKEYEEIKKEYYATRAYFNNTHENMNNVWHIKKTNNEEREQTGDHATPKPLSVMDRIIKTSSIEHNIVIDFFLGSGATLIACEKLNRICYGMEIDSHYCDVIVNRYIQWCKKNNIDKPIKLNGQPYTV